MRACNFGARGSNLIKLFQVTWREAGMITCAQFLGRLPPLEFGRAKTVQNLVRFLTNHPPSVLWHCWLGHLTCKKHRLRNAVNCVEWDVKPCSTSTLVRFRARGGPAILVSPPMIWRRSFYSADDSQVTESTVKQQQLLRVDRTRTQCKSSAKQSA